MGVNRKPSGTAKTIPGGLAMGWLAEIFVTTAACLLLAMLILNGKAGWEAMGYGVMMTLLLSSYLGAAISCKLVERRKLLVCAISGAVYLLTLLAICILFFDGSIDAIWASAILITGGAASAALIHCREKQERIHRKRKRRR